MMYICAWQAPELAPERLISSRMTEASVTLRPPPPYSLGNQRGQPAGLGQRLDECLGILGALVDACQYSLPNRAHSSRTARRYSWKSADLGLMSVTMHGSGLWALGFRQKPKAKAQSLYSQISQPRHRDREIDDEKEHAQRRARAPRTPVV